MDEDNKRQRDEAEEAESIQAQRNLDARDHAEANRPKPKPIRSTSSWMPGPRR